MPDTSPSLIARADVLAALRNVDHFYMGDHVNAGSVIGRVRKAVNELRSAAPTPVGGELDPKAFDRGVDAFEEVFYAEHPNDAPRPLNDALRTFLDAAVPLRDRDEFDVCHQLAVAEDLLQDLGYERGNSGCAYEGETPRPFYGWVKVGAGEGLQEAEALAAAARSLLSSLSFAVPEAIGDLVDHKLRPALDDYDAAPKSPPARVQDTPAREPVEFTAKEVQTLTAAMAGNFPDSLAEHRMGALRKLAKLAHADRTAASSLPVQDGEGLEREFEWKARWKGGAWFGIDESTVDRHLGEGYTVQCRERTVTEWVDVPAQREEGSDGS